MFASTRSEMQAMDCCALAEEVSVEGWLAGTLGMFGRDTEALPPIFIRCVARTCLSMACAVQVETFNWTQQWCAPCLQRFSCVTFCKVTTCIESCVGSAITKCTLQEHTVQIDRVSNLCGLQDIFSVLSH